MDEYFSHKIVISILIILIVVLIYSSIEETPDGKLKVVFLDVGQGDSILIETPGDFQILVDAGRGSFITRKLQELVGKNDKTIDVLIATHQDTDHIGGFASLFDNFNVDYFIKTKWNNPTRTAEILEEKIMSENSKIFTIDRPMFMEIDGVKLYLLWPFRNLDTDNSNASSIILLLEYNGSSLLLTGDAPHGVEEKIAKEFPDLIDIDLLKAGHHGSKTSSSLSFLQNTTPQFFVVSASDNNSYGHPHPSVIAAAEKVGAEIFETSKAGNITFFAENGSFVYQE